MLRHHFPQGNRRGGHHVKDKEGKQSYIEFYAQVVSFGSIASQANSTQTVNIQADSDFEWRKTTYIAENNAVAAPALQNSLPELSLQVTDAGSGRQLFSAAVPISSIAGRGELPFILPVTYIFQAKSSIVLALNNFSAAGKGAGALNWDNIFLTLIGNKIWHYGDN